MDDRYIISNIYCMSKQFTKTGLRRLPGRNNSRTLPLVEKAKVVSVSAVLLMIVYKLMFYFGLSERLDK